MTTPTDPSDNRPTPPSLSAERNHSRFAELLRVDMENYAICLEQLKQRISVETARHSASWSYLALMGAAQILVLNKMFDLLLRQEMRAGHAGAFLYLGVAILGLAILVTIATVLRPPLGKVARYSRFFVNSMLDLAKRSKDAEAEALAKQANPTEEMKKEIEKQVASERLLITKAWILETWAEKADLLQDSNAARYRFMPWIMIMTFGAALVMYLIPLVR